SVKPTSFFDRFEVIGQYQGLPRCHLLIPPDPDHQPRSHNAMLEIRAFLEKNVPRGKVFTDSVERSDALGRFLEDGSCILFGSPSVNPGSESAICSAFGIEPSQSEKIADAGLPFIFVDSRPGRSISSVVSLKPVDDSEFGILIKSPNLLVPADVYSR